MAAVRRSFNGVPLSGCRSSLSTARAAAAIRAARFVLGCMFQALPAAAFRKCRICVGNGNGPHLHSEFSVNVGNHHGEVVGPLLLPTTNHQIAGSAEAKFGTILLGPKSLRFGVDRKSEARIFAHVEIDVFKLNPFPLRVEKDFLP